MENQFSQPNQLTQCEKYWYYSLLRRLHGAFIFLSRESVLVGQELRAGLNALRDSTSNGRIYTGLILLLVATPLTGVGYQLFDKTAHIQGWYYVNYFYLFLVLCPHISIIAALIGVFFLFPQNSKRAFFLIIPIGFHLAKVLWMLTISSNDDFYRIVPSSFLLMGFLFSLVMLICFNWLMGLHFHKTLRHIAAYESLIKLADMKEITEDEAFRLLRQEYKFNKTHQDKY